MNNPEETLIKHILSILDNLDDNSDEKKDLLLEGRQLLEDIRYERKLKELLSIKKELKGE